jgi:hypothetical protein
LVGSVTGVFKVADNTITITTLLTGRFGSRGGYGSGGSGVRGGVCFLMPLRAVGVRCFPGSALFIGSLSTGVLSLLIMKI